MVAFNLKEELNTVTMGSGARYVMMGGVMWMQALFAINCATLNQVYTIHLPK